MSRTRALLSVTGLLAGAALWATPSLDKVAADLKAGNGLAAEADVWAARHAGASEANTHHLLAQAYLLQGDADRALHEADPAQIPAAYADYARKIRIKADLLRNDIVGAHAELDPALIHAPNDDALWADLARTRAKDGDLAGAIIAGRKAAALNPKSVDALLLTASLTRDQTGLLAAIPWFNKVVAVDLKNVPALLELAATQGDSGQSQAMLATTRRVLAIDKTNAQAFYLQAVLAARADKPDLARTLLYRTSPALDQLPAVMLLKGIIEYQSGNNEQAITQLKLLADTQPNNMQAARLLGAVYAEAGDDYAVIDALGRFAERPDADSYTLTTIARAYENVDDRATAAKYLDRATQLSWGRATPFDPGQELSLLARNDAEKPNNANTVVPFIEGLILAGRADDALVKAQSMATLNAGAPLAHLLVGDAQMARGHFPEAMQAYSRAASITVTEPVILRLIDAMQQAGDQHSADRILGNYLTTNPTNTAALRLAARREMQTGAGASAITRLESLRARIGNGDANLLADLAQCWYNQGNPERALPYARAAYALQPGSAATSNTYGWLLFQTGLDKGPGLALLEKAVSIAPQNAALRVQLGTAYAGLGRKESARRMLAPVASNAALPLHDQAARMLGRL